VYLRFSRRKDFKYVLHNQYALSTTWMRIECDVCIEHHINMCWLIFQY